MVLFWIPWLYQADQSFSHGFDECFPIKMLLLDWVDFPMLFASYSWQNRIRAPIRDIHSYSNSSQQQPSVTNEKNKTKIQEYNKATTNKMTNERQMTRYRGVTAFKCDMTDNNAGIYQSLNIAVIYQQLSLMLREEVNDLISAYKAQKSQWVWFKWCLVTQRLSTQSIGCYLVKSTNYQHR